MYSLESHLWYAVQVRSGVEKAVGKVLADKGYQVFCPVVNMKRQWSDRLKVVDRVAFPGYLLCRSVGPVHNRVVDTFGVIRIVGFGGRPVPVPEREVEALRILFDSHLEARPCEFLENGDPVCVTAGPLKGVSGILVRLASDYKVVLSITLLRRSLMATVHLSDVAPAHALEVAGQQERGIHRQIPAPPRGLLGCTNGN